MAHDIISDCLNQIMNAKNSGKSHLEVRRYSKFLMEILDIAQKHKYIEYSFDEKEKVLKIAIKELIQCKTIKPRFNVKQDEVDKYVRRFLPARGFGVLLISTSHGLMIQEKALEENLGGSLIAYFY